MISLEVPLPRPKAALLAVAVLLAATFIFLLAGCTQPALTSPPPPTETPLTISTEATLIPQNSLIASIDVLDPLTLRFTLNRPDAAFLQKLAFPAFSPQSPANAEKYAEGGDLMRNPVGTGPFRFEEWVQGDHITLRRNDAYWGEKPVLDTVTYSVIKDPTARFFGTQSRHGQRHRQPLLR